MVINMKCICKQCGKEFELSESEIDFYRKKNLNLPKRCKECREKNRSKKNAGESNYVNQSREVQYKNVSGSDDNQISKGVYALIAIALLVIGSCIFISNIDFVIPYFGVSKQKQNYTVETSYTLPDDSSPEAPVKPAEVFDKEQTAASDEEMTGETDAAEASGSDTAEQTAASGSDTTEQTAASGSDTSEQTAASGSYTSEQTAASGSYTSEQTNASETLEKQYKFRSTKLLNEHYEKHGGSVMGFSTPEEYQTAASNVVNNPNALHKTEKEDGDDVYYIEDTNEFVIVSTDGYIRTYFWPSNGIAYYEKK